MITKRWIVLAIVSALLVIAFISLGITQSGLAGSDQDAHSLAGAWMTTATLDPEFETPPFTTPGVFTRDGLVINSGVGGTVSMGVWERIYGNRFAAMFAGSELADGTSILFEINATVDLSQDGEQFAGPFTNDIYDTEGNLLFTVTGTVNGERMHLDN